MNAEGGGHDALALKYFTWKIQTHLCLNVIIMTVILCLLHMSVVLSIRPPAATEIHFFKQRLAHMATLCVHTEYWACLRIMQFVWVLCAADSTTDRAYIPTHHHYPTATGSHTEIHQGFAVSFTVQLDGLV